MPEAPRHPCRAQRCPNLVERGTSYCRTHTRAKKKAHDQARGNSSERGYGGRWQKARIVFLRDNPYCNGCKGPANVVDHIEPHRGDHELFWNVDNWQPLCKRCHDQKTRSGL